MQSQTDFTLRGILSKVCLADKSQDRLTLRKSASNLLGSDAEETRSTNLEDLLIPAFDSSSVSSTGLS